MRGEELISTRPPSLCESFRDLARWTANKLNAAASLGVSFNEETVTESLLLKLAQSQNSQKFKIRSWSKFDEGVGTAATGGLPTGADWDFFFADWTGVGITVRIQAKRLYPNGRYESLDGGGQQIRDLRNNCGYALPIYVFYNDPQSHWPTGSWSCQPNCTPRFWGLSAWGCSFAPVSGIPPMKKPRPSDIQSMEPWHCLVCPCPIKAATSATLPHRVAGALKIAYGLLSDSDDTRFLDAPDLTFEPNQIWPHWARRLQESAETFPQDASTESSGRLLDGYLTEHGLKGVALVQQLLPDEEG